MVLITFGSVSALHFTFHAKSKLDLKHSNLAQINIVLVSHKHEVILFNTLYNRGYVERDCIFLLRIAFLPLQSYIWSNQLALSTVPFILLSPGALFS